jgi:hypothetical protein
MLVAFGEFERIGKEVVADITTKVSERRMLVAFGEFERIGKEVFADITTKVSK